MNKNETVETKSSVTARQPNSSNNGHVLIIVIGLFFLFAIAWSLLTRLADLPEARKESAIIREIIKPLHGYETFRWVKISRETRSEFNNWTMKRSDYKYDVVTLGFAPMRAEGSVRPILSAIARRCSEEIVNQMPNRRGNVNAEVVVHAFFGESKERSIENPELTTSASMGRVEN